jgi:hypothetical protein
LVVQKVLVKCEHPELPEDACIELKRLWATLTKCWSRDPGQRPDIKQLILERSFELSHDDVSRLSIKRRPLPPLPTLLPNLSLLLPDLSPLSKPLPDKIVILVTVDAERYVNVDISAAPNSACVRELVFSKLNIFDDETMSQFSIYQTEIGAEFAIGDALTDEGLFELCKDQGDSKGSLKLLVSHSSANVHEPRRLSLAS